MSYLKYAGDKYVDIPTGAWPTGSNDGAVMIDIHSKTIHCLSGEIWYPMTGTGVAGGGGGGVTALQILTGTTISLVGNIPIVGSGILQVNQSGNAIMLGVIPGGGGGEVNTASNLGNGSGWFAQKSTYDLQFKSFMVGEYLKVTGNANQLKLEVTGGFIQNATNAGTGIGLFFGKVGSYLQFNSLTAAGAIYIADDENGNLIVSGAQPEVITASNVGGATGIFKQKSGGVLQFKTISGAGGVSIRDASDNLIISGTTGDFATNTQLTSLSGYNNNYFYATANHGSGIITLGNRSFYIFTGSTQVIWTLPTISSTSGNFLFIKNRGGASLIVSGQNSDLMFDASFVNNKTLTSGSAYIFANDGYNWEVM